MRAVLVVQEENAGHRHPIRGCSTVGRDGCCDVRLTDLTISRRHARIEPDGENWVLKDLDSGNGTFVDGKRIKEEILTGGEALRFGSVPAILQFEAEEVDLTTSQKLKQTLSVRPVRKTRPVAAVLVSTLGVLFLLSAAAYERGCMGDRSSHSRQARQP